VIAIGVVRLDHPLGATGAKHREVLIGVDDFGSEHIDRER
jgi:hypothetical protein